MIPLQLRVALASLLIAIPLANAATFVRLTAENASVNSVNYVEAAPPPRFTGIRRSGGQVILGITGVHVTNALEVSSTLTNWTVQSYIAPGQSQFTDSTAAILPSRFYRLRSP